MSSVTAKRARWTIEREIGYVILPGSLGLSLGGQEAVCLRHDYKTEVCRIPCQQTPINYTCTYLAEHLEGTSHDVVSDYLKRERHTARHPICQLVEGLIDDSPGAYLITLTTVYKTNAIHGQSKWCSGNTVALKAVWCAASGWSIWFTPVVKRASIIRLIFASTTKAADGKTKNDHFQEMLLRAVSDKQVQAKTVLFDSWYGSWQNLKPG